MSLEPPHQRLRLQKSMQDLNVGIRPTLKPRASTSRLRLDQDTRHRDDPSFTSTDTSTRDRSASKSPSPSTGEFVCESFMSACPNLALSQRLSPRRLHQKSTWMSMESSSYQSMQELLSSSGFTETRVVSPAPGATFDRTPPISPIIDALHTQHLYLSASSDSSPRPMPLRAKASFTERILGSIWRSPPQTEPRLPPSSRRPSVSNSVQENDPLPEVDERLDELSVDDEAPDVSYDQSGDATINFAQARAMEWVRNAQFAKSMDRPWTPGLSSSTSSASIAAKPLAFSPLQNSRTTYFDTAKPVDHGPSLSHSAADLKVDTNAAQHPSPVSPTFSNASQSLDRTLRMAKSVPSIQTIARPALSFVFSDTVQSPKTSIISHFSQDSAATDASSRKQLRKAVSQAMLRPAAPLTPLLTLDHNAASSPKQTADTDKKQVSQRVIKLPSPDRHVLDAPQGLRKPLSGVMPMPETPVKRKTADKSVLGPASNKKKAYRLFGRKQAQESSSASAQDRLTDVLASSKKTLPFSVGIVPPSGIPRKHKVAATLR